MKARGRLLVLDCAVVALAALPAAAAAKPGYFTSPHFHYAKALVAGSNGYHLEIQAFPSNVNVSARKGDAEVSYYPRRSWLRHDHAWASLPGVGRVDLRFHEQSRSREDPADNCNGLGPLVRRGFFTGAFEVEGERGYTRVHVHSIHGKIVDEPKQICSRHSQARKSDAGQEELVEASSPRGNGTLSFFADEWAPSYGSRPVFFDANLARFRSGMLIFNSVRGFNEDPDVVAVGKPPLTATVTPPRPFTGSAGFQREADGTFSWLGDLAVELPGVGPVALAGPDFEARACLGRSCKGSKSVGLLP